MGHVVTGAAIWGVAVLVAVLVALVGELLRRGGPGE